MPEPLEQYFTLYPYLLWFITLFCAGIVVTSVLYIRDCFNGRHVNELLPTLITLCGIILLALTATTWLDVYQSPPQEDVNALASMMKGASSNLQSVAVQTASDMFAGPDPSSWRYYQFREVFDAVEAVFKEEQRINANAILQGAMSADSGVNEATPAG